MKLNKNTRVIQDSRKSIANYYFYIVVVLTMIICMVLDSAAIAQSFVSNAEKLGVDGYVYSAVTDGSKLYIGGNFTRVGERTPYGAIADGTSGDVISGNPVPNDQVLITKSDGSGGFYIAGDFTEIGGVSRAGLAHINSSGTVTAWDPDPNGAVSAMAVVGSTVYVGGFFTSVGGQSRDYLAAINSSGNATEWNPDPNSTVSVLEADANSVYVGGHFISTIGGQSRSRLAEISTSTGNATTWDPAPSHAPLVIKKSGSDLYVGGQFTTIAGVSQEYVAAFDMTNGSLTSWDPNPSGTVYDIEFYGSDVILGGSFNAVGGASRSRLAAVDASTATATSWNPSCLNSVYDLTIDGDILYVAGAFFGLYNQPRSHLAAFDMSTEALLDWNPGVNASVNGNVFDIAAGNGNVYVGGGFTGIGGERRLGLAAINLSDLSLDDFNVEVEGYYTRSSVYALELLGNALVVGGDFTTIGGVTRNYLASVSLTTELPTSWQPVVNGDITKLHLKDDILYAVGAFNYLEGNRNRAAAIDINSGLLTSWDPNLNNQVNDIAVTSGSIYLTGLFTTVGGETRNRIAEVDDVDGDVTSWDPNLNNTGNALLVGPDGNIYVGGAFTTVGSDSRQRLASISPTASTATSWNPSTGGTIYDLESTGNILYVGGNFSYTGGITQRSAGAFDFTTGDKLSWNPEFTSGTTIRTIKVLDESVFMFGIIESALGSNVAYGTAVTRTNDAPYDILLSNNSINENILESNVGTLSSTDDSGDTHTYTLVTGAGDDDNEKFDITNTALHPAVPLDYETDPNPTVRVRSTDQNGYYTEKAFSITVNNVIESESDITAFSVSGQTSSATIDAVNHTVTVSLPPGTDVTSVLPSITVNTSATYSPQTAQDFTSPVEYIVTAEDASTQVWTVTVRSPLSGIYSVKTGGDFETMSLAVSYLNTHGIGADVTFEIDGFHSLNTIVGRYPGNTEHTLTITPASAASVATFSNRLTFQGTENVIISGDDLLLFNHSPNSGTAIKLEDDPITNDPSNNILIENTLFKSDAYCIWVQNGHNLEVRGNVFTPYAVTSGSLTALLGNGDLADISFHNNEVYFNETNGANGPAYGVSITALTGTLNVENNVIALNPEDYSTQYGVYIGGATETVNINHNTIITGFNTPTESATIYGIRLLGDPSTALTIKNNIIVMGDLFSGTKTGIDYSPGEITLDVSDNNISSTGGGTMRYASLYGTVYDDTNFTTLQGIIDGTTNSTIVFTDETNLDYSLAGASLNDADLRGVPIAGVTEDIAGVTRSTSAPSKGAFESPNTIATITAFSFTGQIGEAVIDAANFTIDAEIDYQSDITNVAPTISTFAGSSINPLSGNGEDFTSSVTYTVMAEAGNTQEWVVSISEGITWSGTSWSNGTGPGAGSDHVLIAGDYNTADDGTIDVKSITINSGATFTVASEDHLYVVDDIVNNGTLIIESGADLMSFESGSFSGNDVIIKRNTRYADGRYSFVGTPVEQSANVTKTTIGSHVYTYDETEPYEPNDGLGRWIKMSGELVPGVGYTQAMQQEIVFEGVPNVGTVNVTGTYTGTYDDATNEETEGWMLVSNPYATAIDVADFLGPNTNIEGAVYIWDDNGSNNGRGTNADYIIANGTMATNTTDAGGQTRYNNRLGSAQGFFVKLSDDTDTEVSFTPDMRVTGGNSDDNFFRKSVPSHARINLTNDQGLFKQTIVAWIPSIDDAQFDRSFDAKVFSTNSPDLIYTKKGETNLAIQGVSYERNEIYLVVNVSEDGMYTLSVGDINAAHGQALYLHDLQTDELIDLSQKGYTFNAQSGQVHDRFVLLSNHKVLGLGSHSIKIYAHDRTLYIHQPEGEERNLKLISLSGKEVLSQQVTGSAKLQLTLPAGVYIATDGEVSHKIILK
ncbi:MAG: hypothetical protein RIC35_00710 [Marinoscillum sp.]